MTSMRFRVLPVGRRPPEDATSRAYLIKDNWDDWFQYSTLHHLIYCDEQGSQHIVGGVKIGEFNMSDSQRSPNTPETFNALGDEFFSLGQDDTYYQKLNDLGADIRDDILRSLNDLAFDSDLFERARIEHVTGTSLLRSVTPSTVKGQFARLARGGVRLSRYSLEYTFPYDPRSDNNPEPLQFTVKPNSKPPSNIHVLIGRNGVGKTRLLNLMSRALADTSAEIEDVGEFRVEAQDDAGNTIANLVSVTFSAFDPFEPISSPRNRAAGLQYTYIGLKRIRSNSEDKPLPPKDPSTLAREFSLSVKVCVQGARLARWRRALEMLEADPIFSDAEVAGLADSAADEQDLSKRASALFKKLSSGHKIVLLTITRLVESVEERSLVLLDEPEAHLHPPLLGAFIRALSDLLVNRNGTAIIATHSPVVLQEVPRDCAYKLRRSGRQVAVERPEIETFGENVGVLTREIFGLEVTRSGFHRLLGDAVRAGEDYEEITRTFGDRLGGEARGIIRGLIAAREAGDEF